ncbi:MAG: acetylglucosamine-6-sulfatase, partial [Bacteroidales bacterium]|nr:acetylglucosamine-6-sulfatase [Bacteroidales bacterium]
MKMKKLLFLVVAIFLESSGFAQTISSGEISLFQTTKIKPKKVLEISENHYFIDFGKAAFGTVLLIFKTPIKDSLIIHLGEKLVNDSSIDRNPEGSIRYNKVIINEVPSVNTEYVVKLQPVLRHTKYPAIALPDTFGVITPFRYCEIENLSIPISDIIVYQKVYNYRFNDNSSDFTCSDTVLNQVWEMCKHTVKATSFCGLYIDGERERAPYE